MCIIHVEEGHFRKKYFHFTKRIFFNFLAWGITVFILNFFTPIFLVRFVGFILNAPSLVYDFQPESLRHIRSFLDYLPWVALGTVFIVDILKRNFARSISFLLGLALARVFLIGYFFWAPVVSHYVHRTPFNSTSWKNEQPVNHWMYPMRLRMVDDLLKTYELVGMSKNQVDELLSIPEPTGYFRDYHYVYQLGPDRGPISIDSEWLGIKFENDKVVEARILKD